MFVSLFGGGCWEWELAAGADAPDLVGAAFARGEGGAGLRVEELGDKLAGIKGRDMAGKPQRFRAALVRVVLSFIEQKVGGGGEHSCCPLVVGLSVSVVAIPRLN